jgi:hypothetical protein
VNAPAGKNHLHGDGALEFESPHRVAQGAAGRIGPAD